LTEFLAKTRELFPDTERKANTIFSSGDRVISEWTLTATKTEPCWGRLERKVEIWVQGISVVQIKNGKISQWSDYYDQLKSRRNGLAAWFTEWLEL
jgi:limonene-1,2-epoxide hydrolase